MDTPLKQCNKCGEWKPASSEFFHRHKQNSSGFRLPCRSCRAKPKPITRICVRCDNCGVEFTRPPSATKGKSVFYCSRQCASQGFSKYHSGKNSYQYSREDVRCAQCGKLFTRKQSHANRLKNNFCSRKCMGEWISTHEAGTDSPHYKSIPVPCRQCGQEILVPPARINEDGNFCDLECFGAWLTIHNSGPANPLWEGGKRGYYGPNWFDQRRKARERDKHTCQHCGVTKDELGKELDVHHKIPFRSFGVENYKRANHLSNLVTLCRRCHTIAENMIGQASRADTHV